MKKKIIVLAAILIIVASLSFLEVQIFTKGQGEDKNTFHIVTSFYPVYIAALNVTYGAENVELTNLTENKSGCLHDYQLTTKDMRKLETADVLIINGGGMEEFLGEILTAYPEILIIDAGEGIPLLEEEDHGANSHYWMNPGYYTREITNIEKGLGAANVANRRLYQANGENYRDKVAALGDTMRKKLGTSAGEKLIIFHEAFAYLADYLDLTVVECLEMEEDSGFSAGTLADIINSIREEQVELLLVETAQKKEIEQGIAKETNAFVYGLDPMVNGAEETDAYIINMEKNIRILEDALAK